MAPKQKNLPEEKKQASASLPVVAKDLVDNVLARVQTLQSKGDLHLPANYSAENALKSAWLILQETTASVKQGNNFEKVPVLTHCSKTSITNALLKMVILGLDPQKKQCALITYGKQLSCQEEYHGLKAIVLRKKKEVADIRHFEIHEGDDLEYDIVNGQYANIRHKQSFANRKKPIVGAYAFTIDKDGLPIKSDLMDIDEIHRAWEKSQVKPFDNNGNLKPDSTHAKFPAKMAQKTVAARLCREIINSSDDSDLVTKTAKGGIDAEEEIAQTEVDDNMASEVIDIENDKLNTTEPEAEPESISGQDEMPPFMKD